MIPNLAHAIRQQQEFSRDGEELAAKILSDYGFRVFFNREHPYHGYDLMVYPNVAIEVKSSAGRMVNDKAQGFQFNLYRVGHSKRITEPITMLLCVSTYDNVVPFIIPTEIIAYKNCISISSANPLLYKKKWRHYLNAFDRIVLAGGKRFKKGWVTNDFAKFMEMQK